MIDDGSDGGLFPISFDYIFWITYFLNVSTIVSGDELIILNYFDYESQKRFAKLPQLYLYWLSINSKFQLAYHFYFM